MNTSRIPVYDSSNPDGMSLWFTEMAERKLLYHPEESAWEILNVSDDERSFTDEECVLLDSILKKMFEEHGEGVIDACYPIFMRACGWETLPEDDDEDYD